MSEKIEPALTPEEWQAGRLSHSAFTNPLFALIGADLHVATGMTETLGDRTEFDAKERHAIAALALHGQPFGFSWEDVDQLLDTADLMTDGMAFIGGEDNPHRGDPLRSIADRIAALLPPREP